MATPAPVNRAIVETAAVIATGTSLSAAVDLRGYSLVAIQMPASGWTSASLTFQASSDGVLYQNVYDRFGNEVTVVASGGARFIQLDPADWLGAAYIKVRSGTSGSPTNQTGGDTVTLVCREL